MSDAGQVSSGPHVMVAIPPAKAGMTLLKVQMNPDLLTADLKKKRAKSKGTSFVVKLMVMIDVVGTHGRVEKGSRLKHSPKDSKYVD